MEKQFVETQTAILMERIKQESELSRSRFAITFVVILVYLGAFFFSGNGHLALIITAVAVLSQDIFHLFTLPAPYPTVFWKYPASAGLISVSVALLATGLVCVTNDSVMQLIAYPNQQSALWLTMMTRPVIGKLFFWICMLCVTQIIIGVPVWVVNFAKKHKLEVSSIMWGCVWQFVITFLFLWLISKLCNLA